MSPVEVVVPINIVTSFRESSDCIYFIIYCSSAFEFRNNTTPPQTALSVCETAPIVTIDTIAAIFFR
jgi:hypothetical protein